MYKLFMAFRYLRAHKIIYFSIAGVALGIMTLVVVTSIMGGFSRDMRSRIRGMQTDLVVTSFDRGVWFKDYDAWLGRRGIRRDVHVVGIVPERERGVSDLERSFRQGGKKTFDFKGDYSLEGETPGMVLGCELWEGGRLSLVTVRDASPTPIPCTREFEAVGNFKTGMAEYDSTYVFMHLSDAQAFLHLTEPPMANVLAVKVDDYEKNGLETRRAIFNALHARRPCDNPSYHEGRMGYAGQCGPYRVMTWEQTKRILLQAVEVEKGIQIIILFLIVLVAGFNIIAIYTLVVRSKTRDIGILRALGASEGGIVSVFLTSGGLCGLVGSFFGVGLGLLLAYNVNGIADFIRVVSREMNRVSMDSPGRANLVLAAGTLLAAGAAVVWNWLVFYKERLRHPWARMAAAVVILAAAVWLSTTWLPTYEIRRSHDPKMDAAWRLSFAAIVVGAWVSLSAAWRVLDRWRRRPGWIFFGFGATLFLSAMVLAIMATLAIAIAILAARPGREWAGLELFSPEIYYLDRIPVFVDFTTLGFIVAVTLLVSVVFSIYPALRAAACNPIEAIRDE
jgi:lipoprotein-releasing system permease protein